MMNLRNKSAFTLIELLVVIAIIAILAAILFPVFAQAKVAAKKTQLLSNAKQMGLSQIMYAADYDDTFSPVMDYDASWSSRSWAVLCFPYIKNTGILMDQFTPANQNSNPFILNAQWGMPTRRSASAWCPTSPTDLAGCAMGVYNANGRAQLTGNQRIGRSGVGGVNIAPGTWMWSAAGYKTGGYPSLSSTAVTRPADTMLISQSNHSDFMWHQDWNPDEAFRYWGDANFNLFGNSNMTCGPAGRIGTTGQKAGVYPTNIASPSQFPEGTNCSVFVDGHARAQVWKRLMTQFVDVSGGVKYLKWASAEMD